jgi:hypothetical protein
MTTGKAKYAVEEAASMLAKETGERENELFSRLDAAVLSGDLPAYPRGSQLKINYGAQSTYRRCMQPRGYQEYVYWHDLNKWQDENLQQISYRFPNPSAAPGTPAAPVVASEWVIQAQTRAREIVKESRARDVYPSQENLGDQIASEFRKAGITGADGKPLTGATIKRHALNGISSATGKQLSTTIGRGK